MHWLRIPVVVLGILSAWLALPLSLAAGQWKAGAAREKITPREPMWMAGYGSRNHPATGVLNDLWAKSLVLEDGAGTRVAIVTLDLVGIGRDLSEPICAELAAKYRLPRANVTLCCSHTHSGPVVGKNLHTMHYDQLDEQGKQRVDRYAGDLKQSIVELVGGAIAALAPCELSYGQAQATFGTNRRANKEPDVPRLRAEGQLRGPVDGDVPVLKVADASGKLAAVLFGYACHATVLDGYDWCSDYPGFAQSDLEQRFPGCTALFFAGCGADQNPLPRRKVELARQYGHDLAAAVASALHGPMQPLTGALTTRFAEIELPLAKVPSRAEVENDAKSSDRFVASRARWFLELLDSGRPIPASYSYPVQLWRAGNLTLVILGGEVVVDYALRLKAELGRERTWVAAYSNDVMAYIPSRRVLAEGGYEGGGAMVYYGLPSPWTEAVEESIVSAVHKLAAGEK